MAIKKQEEERRRQILQNPIQIKKLQETLLNQKVKSKPSKKKKMKKNKKKKRELDDNIDIIIAQKLKALSKKSLDIRDLTTIPSDDDNLDKVLLKKFTKLKRKLALEDYDEVLNDSKKDLSDGTDSEGNADMHKSETVFKRSHTPDGFKSGKKVMSDVRKNYVNTKPVDRYSNHDYKFNNVNPKKDHGMRYGRLTEEEKEKRRREMMENASWRDKERVKNVQKYREEDAKEAKQQDFNPEFIHKELLKSANSSSVESRVKSNIKSIQRSKGDMDRNFSRRH